MDRRTLDLAIALRRELHAHPELSNEEVHTKARLLAFLRQHTTRLHVKDCGTYFYAVYRRPPPTVAASVGDCGEPEVLLFRADFDALPMDEGIPLPWASQVPGKSHKCGHDGHSATLMAFAMEVDRKGAMHDLVLLWQPAEEVGAGAIQCLPALKVEGVTRAYGYHNMAGFPFKSIVVRDDVIQCASVGMILHFDGVPAHASQPEKGRNPSLAIASLIQAIPQLTGGAKDLLLCTVVQVNIGARQFGMSAYQGELLLTIRAVYEEELEKLKEQLVRLSEEAAARDGLKVAITYSDAFPETRNAKVCVDHVRAVARSQGRRVWEMDQPFRPSEDFGHFGKAVPACYFFIGNGEEYPPIHTSAYDFRDDLIEVGAAMFKGLAGVKDSQPSSL